MICEHDLVIRDGFSDKKAVKVTVCKKCLEIKNVLIQGEKIEKVETEKEMWANKDKRMARMNALSHATEIVKEIAYSIEDKPKRVMELAETFVEWIYRE